jgi:hypothetical protein
LRFASSLYAIGKTLRRRRIRVEQTQLALAKGEGTSEVDREDQVTGDDEAVIGELLRDRTPNDLAWERQKLDQLIERLGALTEIPSKFHRLLQVIDQRRTMTGRVQQVVVFTRFADTLDDIVRRLRAISSSLLIGGEIDILVCTDGGPQPAKRRFADQLRSAVEPDEGRAADRTHRSHRAETR